MARAARAAEDADAQARRDKATQRSSGAPILRRMALQLCDSMVPTQIPAGAEELRDFAAVFENLDYRGYTCVLDGKVVGYRVRTVAGRLVREHGLKDGRRHGPWRQWDDEGRLAFETSYLDGLEHGIARQWIDGQLQITYRMDRGTGVDLWVAFGSLSEERHMKDGYRHGYERWWNWDDRTVRREGHYRMGREYGIFREWNAAGRVRRGYPRYFVDGRRVTRREYLHARRSDPSLPPILAEDNEPTRRLPPEYLAQQARARRSV
jgi:hypothetical protein